MHVRSVVLVLALLAAAVPALPTGRLAAQPSDTTAVSVEPLFTRRDAYLAAAFLATTLAVAPLDEKFAEKLRDPTNQQNRFYKNAAVGVEFITAPGSYVIGGSLYLVGRLTRNERMADLGWHGTEAILVGTVAYNLGKGIFGRARPETTDAQDATAYKFGRGFGGGPYASFPSGHATTAFAAASAVTAETWQWWPKARWVIAPAMYGGATLVGLSRMYDNKHWASDVGMGALLGTFSGIKVVQYHHSHPNNKLDEWILGGKVDVVPTANGDVAVVWARRTR